MIESTADGSSRFTSAAFDLTRGDVPADVPLYAVTPNLEPERMVFTEFPPGFAMDLHPAPRRQYIIMLSGAMEVTAGNGEHRRFEPGDVLFVNDLDGRGHATAAADGKACAFASVAVPEPPPRTNVETHDDSPSKGSPT